MFVIVDIKFRVANIKWNLLVSTGYYLLNWALASDMPILGGTEKFETKIIGGSLSKKLTLKWDVKF